MPNRRMLRNARQRPKIIAMIKSMVSASSLFLQMLCISSKASWTGLSSRSSVGTLVASAPANPVEEIVNRTSRAFANSMTLRRSLVRARVHADRTPQRLSGAWWPNQRGISRAPSGDAECDARRECPAGATKLGHRLRWHHPAALKRFQAIDGGIAIDNNGSAKSARAQAVVPRTNWRGPISAQAIALDPRFLDCQAQQI